MTAPFQPTVRMILQAKLAERLADDPLCGGRFTAATIAAILEDVEEAVVAVHNRAIRQAADVANSLRGNRADHAAAHIRKLKIDRPQPVRGTGEDGQRN